MTKTAPFMLSDGWLLAACALLLATASALSQQDLSPSSGWTLHPSHEAVKATLNPAKGLRGEDGFSLSYNFTGGSGFIVARHEFPSGGIDLPENFEFSFTLTGTGPSNNLEVKLLDAPDGNGSKLGDSVWWINRRNFEWPESPTRLNNKAKHFQFAWGPLNGAKIKRLGAIEVVVASSSGGQGTIHLTDLQFRALPVPSPYTGTPKATASTAAPDHPAAFAIDADAKSAWIDDDNAPAELTVDFGQPRDLDALRIDWATPARAFTVDSSDDGQKWLTIWTANPAATPVARSYADIPDTTARMLRISIAKSGAEPVGVADVRFLTNQSAATDNLGIMHLIASDLPPEAMPRYFTGRQSTWTVLGSPTGADETLINEEGDVELFRSGPMLSALLLRDGQPALRWTSASQRMDFDGVPTAIVERKADGLTLTTSAFSTDAETLVRYTLACTKGPASGRLALCIRPFQVNPPWQFLNAPGGLAKVRSIEQAQRFTVINGERRIMLPDGCAGFTALGFDQGEAASQLFLTPELTATNDSVTDPHNAASAAVFYPFQLDTGESNSWLVRIQHKPERKLQDARAHDHRSPTDPSLFNELRASERAHWSMLDGFNFTLPPGYEQLQASIRASLAYILINRDGPGFQPGSRSYERSWIRDGALTSAALLEFGLTEEVKQFIDWYAAFQFPGGGIPCVVDRRGADPVTENDSHGQFIYALAEYHRYSHDDAFLLKHFAAVEKAVAHIEAERNKRKTAEFRSDTTRAEPGKPPVPFKALYGLMPESISHEGYSSKPMHSYWDDFFTLKGLRDAAEIARALSKPDQAALWEQAATDLAGCVKHSIALAQVAHGITYIPGCPELGDFDATSTTIAINPCDALNDLPREWYNATFDKWWESFVARRDGKQPYVDYTPYEWRIVGTLIMLGHRNRAWESLQWYMRDQLPPRSAGDTTAGGWLHWAEIVHNDRGAGKWIGDMPHTWVASDFLRSIRTMFVYEEPSPSPALSTLVLFAGIPAEWADAPEGVSFTGLRTPYGTLNASLKKVDGWYILHYDGLDQKNLPCRVRLAPPLAWPPKEHEITEGEGSQSTVGGGIDGITTSMTIRFR
ncbi:MAG: discoidin domain-containing protein [Phycisphaerales bacterium]|nr:discoidin domain-containing protein [Phycisphaerales bacterium]